MKFLLSLFLSCSCVLYTVECFAQEVNNTNKTTYNTDASANSSTNSNAVANPEANSSIQNSGTNSNESSTQNIVSPYIEGPRTSNDYRQVNSAQAQSLPNASINNTSINNNSVGSYKVGEAVCSTPIVSINAYGSMNNGNLLSESQNYGASLSLQVPLGGRAASSCNRLAEATSKKLELSNTIGLIDTCINYAKAGVKLTVNAPLELRQACSYITITSPSK